MGIDIDRDAAERQRYLQQQIDEHVQKAWENYAEQSRVLGAVPYWEADWLRGALYEAFHAGWKAQEKAAPEIAKVNGRLENGRIIETLRFMAERQRHESKGSSDAEQPQSKEKP